MIKKLLVGLMSLMLTFMFMMPVSAQDNGLEIGPELIDRPVRQSTLPAPTIGKVFYDATTISGANVQRKRINGKTVRSTVHMTLKDKNGNVKATVSVTPTSGTSWTVNLPGDVTVAAGDTVTAYQTWDGATSDVVTANAEPSMASGNKDKIKMPAGEIWIEATSSNQLNDDEKAEATEMLNKANPDIANDFKSVNFSIDGTDHAYYEVTYTDGSTSGKIEAPDLIIKTVTEKSAAPTIKKVQVTDEQIIVTLDREVVQGTKFYFVKNFTDGEDKNFCENGSCKVDKSTSEEMSQKVTIDGTTVTFQINNDDLILEKEFGIVVKEPHKFRSCAKSEPVITTPDKVAVRDPKKLTDADKTAIEKAIRDANTVNGVSKLPDGTAIGVEGVPAFIEFDEGGNVTIISPNDVEVTYDSNYNPVYAKNPDGTYKVKEGAKVTKFLAKDLVKNIAPKSPAIAVDTDKGEVTITPPAYKDPGDDTDLISYTVSYNDDKGNKHSVTATRDLKTNKWSGTGVDEETGVIALSVEKIELAGTITAISKDNGGLEGDTDKLDSVEASKTLETATVSYDGNKGIGKMEGKKLNKGSKYKILDNKFKTPDENQKFKAWEVDGKEVDAGTEITVTKDTVVTAVWKDIEVTVSYNANGGSGTMAGKTMKKGSKYTLLENTFKAPDETQEFKAWEVDGKEVAAGKEITVDKDTEVKAVWKKIPVKITYDANGGSGEMKGKTVDKGSEYTVLPNAFKAPNENQEFDTWEVNGTKVAPGTKIKAEKDTVIKAVWKDIEVKVSYDSNGGSGKMAEKTIKKGSKYKLLANGFTAPKNKKFKAWQVNGKEVAAGTEITVDKDIVIKAIWQDKPSNASENSANNKDNPNGPKTGDSDMIYLYSIVLIMASGTIFAIGRKRSKEK